MTINFSNFAKLEIADKTADYTLHELDEMPKPALRVRPAGADNSKFFNEFLRQYNTADKINKRAGGRLDMTAVDENLAMIRNLYPKHVVVGWSGIKDADGNEVPFSQSACFELFEHLPSYVLLGIRQFCEDPASFRDGGAAALDAVSVAGN